MKFGDLVRERKLTRGGVRDESTKDVRICSRSSATPTRAGDGVL